MTELVGVVNIMKEIQLASGAKAKKEILSKYKHNELLMSILKFSFDSNVVTNIAKKKLAKKFDGNIRGVIATMDGYMQFLRKCTGKDNEVRLAQQFIESQPRETHDFLRDFTTKSLKIGITAKGINEAVNYNFIPAFSVMLPHNYSKHGHKLTGSFTITPKLDGTRLLAFNDEDGVKFFSRNGKEFEGLVEIAPQIAQLPKGMIFDGELLAVNDGSMTVLEQYRLTQSLSKTKGDKLGLEFNIFDLIPIDKFKEGIWEVPYVERRRMLESDVLDEIEYHFLNFVHVVRPWYQGEDKDMIAKYEAKAYEMGMEGIMISMNDGAYVCDRTINLMRIKEEFTADILVLDVKSGEAGSKYEHTLGALMCDYKGFELGVGGISDNLRDSWWKSPGKIIGKIITLKHNGETKSQNGNIGVRFPRFFDIRDDKGVNDVSYD